MLQFSDTTNKNGIIQRIEFDTGLGDASISDNAVFFSQVTSIVNSAVSKATSIIMTADGKWTWDDTSHEKQAVACTDIVTDQGDYTILNNTPSSAKDYLKIERVEIKDNNGLWARLKERNLPRYQDSITQRRTTTGIPTTYDFNGVSIFLDAVPNYDGGTNSLKIWFSRAQINFATTDTTKRPGFASIFHEYPVMSFMYHWEKQKGTGNPEQTKRDLVEMESAMRNYYNMRDKSQPNKVQRVYKSYK